MDLGQLVKSAFKFNGYNLNIETTKYVVELLQKNVKEKERDNFLENLIDYLTKSNLDCDTNLNKNIIETAYKELNWDKKEDKNEVLFIINAYEAPRAVYCETTKKYLRIAANTKKYNEKKSLIANADSKIEIYFQRFYLIQQRTLRHELFSPSIPSATNSTTRKKFQLKPIEYLLSNSNNIQDIIVLGMITQLKENKFFLEDPSGSLELNLAETKYHSGIYTEGCFVLAEGNLVDGIFEVKGIGFPPAELESTTRAYFGNVNYFGGPNELSCKSSLALSQAGQTHDTMIVFLSDVWLDKPQVMEKLQTLFIGYSDCPPYAFVLCGNFLSEPRFGLRCDKLEECFNKLTDLIGQFKSIRDNSHFIFVPGPLDPGTAKIYPRAGILPHCTEYVKKKIPKCHFTTNPCRIQYGSRQIVVFREDLMQKLIRNAIKIPETDKLTEDMAKTLICQAHLTPLPLHVTPIYWNYDHIMRLYPLPDLVVVADKQKSFHHDYMDCTVMNPGSFPNNNFSFKVYIPSSKKIEDCLIQN